MPRARIEAADDNDVTNVRVTAEWIVGAGANALAIVIPIVVITVVMLVPALVLAVVVAVAVVIIVVAVLVPALVFAVVVAVAVVIIVVAVLVPALVFAVVVVLGAGRDSRREGKYGRSKSQKWQELFHDLLSQRSLVQEWAYSRCPLCASELAGGGITTRMPPRLSY